LYFQTNKQILIERIKMTQIFYVYVNQYDLLN